MDETPIASEGAEPSPRMASSGHRPDELAQALRNAGLFSSPHLGEHTVPERFGQYVVLGTLGRGGMGVVLEAYDRSLDRKVAIKLMHRNLASEHTERLVREAKALARLSHPNVVQVHEVGNVNEQTFVSMELVEGQTLQQWQAVPRPWRECIRVYQQAGRGLAAAHRKDLVHRDFKPANCILDDEGRVRVLDFGLVRELGIGQADIESEQSISTPGLEEISDDDIATLTQRGTVLGTLAYMPPEQLRGEAVDAHADQFSFCVALYEAVYGERPFEGKTMATLAAALAEGQIRPTPAGVKAPAALQRILHRGLAVEAARRWASMDELLTHLERLVAPRGRWWTLAGLCGGLATLGAGLALGQYAEVKDRCTGAREQLEGHWDEEQKQRIEVAVLGTDLHYAQDTWERVEHHLDEYADDWVIKHTEVCEATSIRGEQTAEVMDLRMECLRERRVALSATAEVLAQADERVVDKAVSLATSLPELSRCDEIKRLREHRQRVPPPEDPDEAARVEELRDRLVRIEALMRAGQFASGLEQVEAVLEHVDSTGYVPLLAEAKLQHGFLRYNDGKYDEAEQELTEAYVIAVEYGHDDVVFRAATFLSFLVGVIQSRHAEGLLWDRTALPLAKRSGETTKIASSIGNRGSILFRQGKYEEAKDNYHQALQLWEGAFGADHPSVANNWRNLGNVFLMQRKYQAAETHFRRALQIRQNVWGLEHPDIVTNMGDIGTALSAQGKYREAEEHLEQVLHMREDKLGANHPAVARTLNDLGATLSGQGRHEEAERQIRRALAIWERTLGPESPHVATGSSNLSVVRHGQKEYPDAEQHARRAVRIWEHALGADHPALSDGLIALAAALHSQQRYDEAEPHYQRALQILEREGHPTITPLVGLAKVALARQEFQTARTQSQRAVSILETSEGAPDDLAEARFVLARALWNEPSERARALLLAKQSRDAYAEVGPGAAGELAAVNAWIAEHQLE